MKIVTAAEMREIDRASSERFGVPSLTLMENAGSAVAGFVLRQYPRAQRIAVLCGKGNNGGDGLVAARKLREAGKDVGVVLLARTEDVKGDARQMLERLGFTPTIVASSSEVDGTAERLRDADIILDAVFGTGFRPPLPELAAQAIDIFRTAPASVVSVDIPSGADADSFGVEQPDACRSDAIVTFTAPKPGIVFGALTRGPIMVAHIGSPEEAVESRLGLEWNAPPPLLSEPRRVNSHKGLYGHVLVVGGSLGKSGAPSMASLAALRVGAGLVTVAVPRSILSSVAAITPELMTEPLEESASGSVAEGALAAPVASALLARKNVIALGPGLGRDAGTVTASRAFVKSCPLPMVLDADGLNAFENGGTDASAGAHSTCGRDGKTHRRQAS
jgi:hydroxyethylthiazole kinase-like uncharacterized protein yjeF